MFLGVCENGETHRKDVWKEKVFKIDSLGKCESKSMFGKKIFVRGILMGFHKSFFDFCVIFHRIEAND